MRIVALLFGVVVVAGLVAAGEDAKPSDTNRKRPEDEIKALIKQLADERFKVREAATRRLMERDDALPALREALRTEDAEVRQRVQQAIDAITKRAAKRDIRRALAMLKRGEVDRFVAQVVAVRDHVDEECWKAVFEHAQTIAGEAGKLGGKFKMPWADITKLRAVASADRKEPNFIGAERLIAQSVATKDGHIARSLVLSDGPMTDAYQLAETVVFVNGNLKVGASALAQLGGCLVICDGDVIVSAGVSDSIILARGSVRVGVNIVNSVILSGGEVTTGWKIKPKVPIVNSVVKMRQRNLLKSVHFFDLRELGIDVKASGEEVWIDKVEAGKPFARADVRPGDQIVALNGTKMCSVEAFRRMLRWQVMAPGTLALELRREGKPQHVQVTLSKKRP